MEPDQVSETVVDDLVHDGLVSPVPVAFATSTTTHDEKVASNQVMADPDQVSEAVETEALPVVPVVPVVAATHHDGKGAPETLSSASADVIAQQLLSSSSSLGRHGGPPTHGRRPRRPNPKTKWRNALHKMHYVKTKLRGRRGNDDADNGQGWDYTSSEEESDENEEAPTTLFTLRELSDIVINAELIERRSTRTSRFRVSKRGKGKDGHIDNELVDDNMAGVLQGFLTERRADQILGMLKSTNAYITLIVLAWLLVRCRPFPVSQLPVHAVSPCSCRPDPPARSGTHPQHWAPP